TLYAKPPAQWLTPWMRQPPDPLEVNIQWTGVFTDGALTGRLDVQDAKFRALGARGRVAVQTIAPAGGAAGAAGAGGAGGAGGGQVVNAQGTTVFNPQRLILTTQDKSLPEIQLTSGTVCLQGSNVRL